MYGLTQADALAEFLATNDPRPERVFSSAFYRCIQTAVPTAARLGVPVALEHGVGEWYSTVNPDTGLHPRPSTVSHLSRHFPPSSLDLEYQPTVFPSRKGESLKDLQDRADLFVETWTSRVEDVYPKAKAVVIFAHAASVIALGRAVSFDRKDRADS
jgi:transcription factor C subunit 7